MTSPNDIITLYLSDNQNIANEIERIQTNIDNNNSNIKNKTFKNKYDAMQHLIIKKNHYIIQNSNLNKKIKILINKNINEKRRKFKILILILDDILMAYFNNNKNKTKNQEFIYLAAFAIKNMYHMIPNVNNDIFMELLSLFKNLLRN